MWQKATVFSGIYLIKVLYVNGHCVDIHSQIVSQGLHYVPGPNSCTLCICDKGGPKWCKSVLCSQPQNCKSFQRGNSCCEFKCLDDILTANDTYKDTYDLALRLIASAVFVILTLSLLFFVIHRFRRHKLQVRQNRQLGEDRRSLNSIGYITGSLGYLPGSIGYLGTGSNDLEFQYEESNSHYSLWKPHGNYFPRGEAPPPYEEAIRSAQIDSNVIDSQTVVTSTPNEVSVQPHQLRPSQNQSNSVQCRHQHLTNRSTNNNNNNNNNSNNHNNNNSNNNNHNNSNQEYANVTIETVSTQHVEPLVKLEKNLTSNLTSKSQIETRSNRSSTSQDRNIKYCASTEKSKSYENIVNRKNEKPMISSSSERRNVKHKSQTPTEYERLHTDKNNFKFHKYENIILRNSVPKESQSYTRKIDKSHIENNVETCYENLNPGYENTRHKMLPHFSEYQSKPLSRIKENKNKDNIHFSIENSLRRELDKTCFGEKSENNLRSLAMLKEYTDMPLHRTLPKNLKELTVSVSSNSEYIPGDIFRRLESDSYTHRTLPKQLSNHDAVLSVNLVKSQINLSESFNKDCTSLKPHDFESASSSRVGLLENKSEEKLKIRDDERSFISYQCLSSSQDEDDYRSECENCKSSEMINVEDEEGDVFNETMTLQRRPETSEEVPYYRTSLTLPTQIRKPRAVTPNPSRNGWFMAVQETSSSEESE
ncbi:hypothetical protein ILUMI_20409 [Ignelater luminosus]|uniref:Integral membrane protein DGCR2/IDD n=1 Tax=Ignelater luminosus TaxID=2038154 RepID=A0A8K0CEC1_IGNLU|nr:hypothetical protein ILUMI_20409 [Ignelater luminosus]